MDVVVSTREGWIHAWSTAGHADQVIEWASLHHDPGNTGDHSLVLPVQAGPVMADGTKETGCGCAVGEPQSGLAWAWLALICLIWRRRGLAEEALAE